MAFGFQRLCLLTHYFIGGGDNLADTPDPFPNSEVKRFGGENTYMAK